MSTSPYQPPRSHIVDRGSEPASATKAVLIALAIDLGGSMSIGTGMAMIYAGMLISQGMDPEQAMASLENIPPLSLLSLMGMACGTLVSGIAGYVCAHLSQRRDYKLGFILAGIGSAFALLTSYDMYPAGLLAALIALTFIAILTGMKLGMPKPAPSAA